MLALALLAACGGEEPTGDVETGTGGNVETTTGGNDVTTTGGDTETTGGGAYN